MTDLGTFREKKFSRIGPKIREILRIRENFFSRKLLPFRYVIIWLDNDKRGWATFEVFVWQREVASCWEKGLWSTQDAIIQSFHCNPSLIGDPIQELV